MVAIRVSRDKNGALAALTVDGHATSDITDKAGYTACIAASILLQGLVTALRTQLPSVQFAFEKDKGMMRLAIVEANHMAFPILTDGFLAAVAQLAEEQPNYITYADE